MSTTSALSAIARACAFCSSLGMEMAIHGVRFIKTAKRRWLILVVQCVLWYSKKSAVVLFATTVQYVWPIRLARCSASIDAMSACLFSRPSSSVGGGEASLWIGETPQLL